MNTSTHNFADGVKTIDEIFAETGSFFRGVHKEEAMALFKVRFLMNADKNTCKRTATELACACAMLIGTKHKLNFNFDNLAAYNQFKMQGENSIQQKLYEEMKKDGSIFLVVPNGYLKMLEKGASTDRANFPILKYEQQKRDQPTEEWIEAKNWIRNFCESKGWEEGTAKLAVNLFVVCTVWGDEKLAGGDLKNLALALTLLAAKDQAHKVNLHSIATHKACTLNIRGIRNWIDEATKKLIGTKAHNMMRNPKKVSRTQMTLWYAGTENSQNLENRPSTAYNYQYTCATNAWERVENARSSTDTNWRL